MRWLALDQAFTKPPEHESGRLLTMARATPISISDSSIPEVNRIGVDDLKAALQSGLADFREKPSHLVFLVIVYPIMALLLARSTFGYSVLPLLFPLTAGFALLGPLAAVGLYELSRRREQGLEVGWRHAFGVLRSPSIGAILTLGTVLLVTFVLWLAVAMGLYAATLGTMPASVGDFLDRLFTTGGGWALIILGNGIGLLFAVFVLMISVVSFPMLVDRPVSASTAARTSVRAVLASPATMAVWGLIITAGLVLGCLPFFVGLAVVMPVLGHASWHLYRRVVQS
jgi:uncharacterized membrane protein